MRVALGVFGGLVVLGAVGAYHYSRDRHGPVTEQSRQDRLDMALSAELRKSEARIARLERQMAEMGKARAVMRRASGDAGVPMLHHDKDGRHTSEESNDTQEGVAESTAEELVPAFEALARDPLWANEHESKLEDVLSALAVPGGPDIEVSKIECRTEVCFVSTSHADSVAEQHAILALTQRVPSLPYAMGSRRRDSAGRFVTQVLLAETPEALADLKAQ